MSNLLRIDASPRTSGSYSRDLGDYFEDLWRRQNPAGRVTRRDLAAQPVIHIAQSTVVGFYTPADQMTAELRNATAISDRLIAELQSTDALLLTTPIYNFTVPSGLKAWIDQVVRIGHTFSYDGQSFNGLVKADRAYVICAYGMGGYLDDGPSASVDFLKPYLSVLLHFLGISDVRFVGVEATAADAQTVAAGMLKARAGIDTLLAH